MNNSNSEKTVFERIYEQVRKIPKGKVNIRSDCPYAGNARRARVVGYALHVNPAPDSIPCYRVVNRQGRVSPAFAFGGENMQILMLRSDGIEVSDDGIVPLDKYIRDSE